MNKYGERIDASTVRFERLLPGPIERVWTFLTDGDRRAEWLCAGRYDLEAGGDVEMIFDNSTLSVEGDAAPPEKYRDVSGEVRMSGTVLRCDAPRLLEHTWVFGEEDSIVRYELEPAGDRVRLVLTHTRLATDEMVLDVSGGWHTHLDLLESLLEAAPPPRFWASITRLENEYANRYGLS